MKLKKYHFHPFGRLVTPRLRWIVLKSVDIQGVSLCAKTSHDHGQRTEITPARNPYNGDALFYHVDRTDKPSVVASVHHWHFNVSHDLTSEDDYLDILEKCCEPAFSAERELLRDVVNSIRCPHFDHFREDVLRYLTQYGPIDKIPGSLIPELVESKWSYQQERFRVKLLCAVISCSENPCCSANSLFSHFSCISRFAFPHSNDVPSCGSLALAVSIEHVTETIQLQLKVVRARSYVYEPREN